MQDKPTQPTSAHEATDPINRFATMGERHRADSIKSVEPSFGSQLETVASSTDDIPPVEVQEQPEIITRRKLRQQEREIDIKNHPIKHLGRRALYRILRPFSK